MTQPIALTLTIVLVALVLFITDKLRVDLVALLVLLSVGLLGLVDPEHIFDGFSNPAVITVWAVYIVSGGLFKTGVAERMGRFILRLSGTSESGLVATIMLTCGLLSAFMNNVGATAMLLPAVIGISRQTKVPASKLLLPLSFSSLLGGKMTLIGTPANILATNILAERGLPTLGFFDFTVMGVIILATGTLYMVLLGRHLIPVRESGQHEDTLDQLRDYVTEVRISSDSPLAGMSLYESQLGDKFDLTVVAIVREGKPRPRIRRDTVLQAGDLLMVEGSIDNLMRARRAWGLVIEAEHKLDLHRLEPGSTQVIEATLAPNSRLAGRSLREIRFRDQYGYTALAIWRHGEVITERLRDLRL